jgi:hypothetical protein
MAVRRSLYVTATAGGVGTTAVAARIDQAALFTPNGDLGVVPGIISGLVVTGIASGWAYNVTKGHGLTTRAETDGAALLAVDGTTTTPAPVLAGGGAGTTSAPVSGSRYEMICLLQRDLDAAEADNVAALVVVQGTASGSPVRPVVPTGALVMYEVLVPSGAANTAAGTVTITRVAPQVGLRGTPIPVTGTAQRDQLTAYATATSPLYVDRLDTGVIERSIGSGWSRIGGGTGLLGQVLNNADIGALPAAATDYVVPGQHTFTTTTSTVVRVSGRLRFWASNASQTGYLKTMLVAGSAATLTGATSNAAASQVLTAPAASVSSTGVTTSHEYEQTLPAGTWTCFLAAGSATGTTMSVGQSHLAVHLA